MQRKSRCSAIFGIAALPDLMLYVIIAPEKVEIKAAVKFGVPGQVRGDSRIVKEFEP